MSLRGAVAADIPFLAHAIRAADGGALPSGSTWERVLGLGPEAVESALATCLAEPTSASPLSLDAFLILEADGERVASGAAWVEGADGAPSSFVTAGLLARAVGPATWKAARPGLQILARNGLARTPGTLQFESLYVPAEFRGKGWIRAWIAGAEARARCLSPAPSLAELLLVESNQRALRAYEAAGYLVTRRSPGDEALVAIVGGPTFAVMTHALDAPAG